MCWHPFPSPSLATPLAKLAVKKFLFDLFPIILFFVAYQIAQGHPQAAQDSLLWLGIVLDPAQKPGVFIATLVAIVATFAQIGWLKLRGQKIDAMLWVSLVLIVVFGSATLIFHNETFIKWKPTVLYWVFALALALAPRLSGRNLIQLMMQGQLQLPAPVWTRLNLMWATFFAFMGVANAWVANSFDTDTWVTFKMFGTLGLMLVFVLAQGVYLSRHMKDPA
jgi:intracellular septation protein